MPVLATAARTTPRTLAAILLLAAPALLVAVKGFGLSPGGAIALYFTVWWTTLFAVLPFAARAQGTDAAVPGADPGAPASPRLREKALWTTLWADLVFVLAVAALPLAGL